MHLLNKLLVENILPTKTLIFFVAIIIYSRINEKQSFFVQAALLLIYKEKSPKGDNNTQDAIQREIYRI